jgi:hypothetical protein
MKQKSEEKNRHRFTTLYEGEDSIEAGVCYELDTFGKPMKA